MIPCRHSALPHMRMLLIPWWFSDSVLESVVRGDRIRYRVLDDMDGKDDYRRGQWPHEG